MCLSLCTIVKMALEEMIHLAHAMTKPFINDPRFPILRHCMPQVYQLENDFKSFVRELRSEASRLDHGDLSTVLYNAQSVLDDDLFRRKFAWSSSEQLCEEMNDIIIFEHIGVAHVRQTKLFLEYPAAAMTQSRSFIEVRTKFLREFDSLLRQLGHKVPKTFRGSQLFLPTQLIKVPEIRAHFTKSELPDCLGRMITHMLVDAGCSNAWQAAHIDSSDILGRTALYYACRDHDVSNAEKLLSDGARLDIPATNGLLPIHLAAISGAKYQRVKISGAKTSEPLSFCEMISEKWVNRTGHHYNVSIPDGSGRSAFLWAAFFGHRSTLEFICSRSPASLTYRDSHGSTAASLAVINGHMHILKWLIQHRFSMDDPDIMGCSPFWHASKLNFQDAMKLLAGHGASVERPDIAGMTPLHIAAHNGCTDAVDYLLSLNNLNSYALPGNQPRICLSKWNCMNQAPLVLAVIAGHQSCVQSLVKHGRIASGDANVLEAAKIAYQKRDVATFAILGQSPLFPWEVRHLTGGGPSYW